MIKERQDEYYKVLGDLEAIYDVFCEITETDQVPDQLTDQVKNLLYVMGDNEYSTKDLMV